LTLIDPPNYQLQQKWEMAKLPMIEKPPIVRVGARCEVQISYGIVTLIDTFSYEQVVAAAKAVITQCPQTCGWGALGAKGLWRVGVFGVPLAE